MKQIFHILKYKLIVFFRLESKLTAGSILKNLITSAMYSLFAVIAFLFTRQTIWTMLHQFKIGIFLFHEFMSILLFILFISINVGNIVVAYSTLYKSSEINFYFTKPVEPVKIFFIKYLDNFFYSSSTLLLILFAVLAGYAASFNLGVGAFIFLFLNFFIFMLCASMLGIIILIPLIKTVSKFGWKRIIAALAAAYAFFVFAFFKINSPSILIAKVLSYGAAGKSEELFHSLIPPAAKYFPNHWLSQTALLMSEGSFITAAEYFLIQFVFSIILIAVMFVIGKRMYYRTWLLNNATSARKKEKYSHFSLFNFNRKIFINTQFDSLIKREILLFLREPVQVIHAIVLLFLIIIFLTSVKGIHFIGYGNYFLQTTIFLSIFIFNMLLIVTLALRFVFPLVSLEGQSYWKIKSSPVSPKILLYSKLTVYAFFIILIGLSISYFSNKGLAGSLQLFSVLLTMIILLTVLSINLGMGGIFVNFKEKNAIRIASSQGATLSFLLNILYILFISVLIFRPLTEIFYSFTFGGTAVFSKLYLTLLPIFLISALIIFFFNRFVYKSLGNDL